MNYFLISKYAPCAGVAAGSSKDSSFGVIGPASSKVRLSRAFVNILSVVFPSQNGPQFSQSAAQARVRRDEGLQTPLLRIESATPSEHRKEHIAHTSFPVLGREPPQRRS